MKKSVFLVLWCLLFFSCAEKADLDPRERFVEVYAVLENSDVQTVNLTYTSYISESEYLPVPDAEVVVEQIDDNSASLKQYVFKKVKDGCWQADFTPKAGEKFKLTVNVPDMKVITSYTEFPDTLRYWGVRDLEEITYLVGYHNPDYRSKKTVYWVSFYEYFKSSDSYKLCEKVQAQCEKGSVERYRITPNYDSPYIRNYANVYERDKVIDFYSKGYAYFIDLDDSPRINCNPEIISNKYYNKNNPVDWICHPESYFLIQTLSAEYDRYLIETYEFYLGENRKKYDDLTHLWEYVEVYTNIENGAGIFGATYKLKVTLQESWNFDLYKRYDIK